MFVMHQDCLSPHQLPLARELVKRLGADNFRYVYRDQTQADRVHLGWQMRGDEPWQIHIGSHPQEAHDLIENADALLTMFRDTALIARRSAKGLRTFYDSERWFKPLCINLKIPLSTCFLDLLSLSLPGWLKLLSPSYFKMAMRMARLILTDPNFRYLPIGPHAARDMRLICRLYSILHLHLSPSPSPAFIPWGYFVAPAVDAVSSPRPQEDQSSTVHLHLQPTPSLSPIRVLYVGRLLKLKRIDTIIRAVAHANSQLATINPQPSFTLTIVGDGPEKDRLQKLSSTVDLLSPPAFSFQPSIPISSVRALMRQHDILVFASNALDGWGAVVSEALAEGVPVIGTYETGASAALLPDTQLFHSGNYKELARKLVDAASSPRQNKAQPSSVHLLSRPTFLISSLPPAYTPSGAADKLLHLL